MIVKQHLIFILYSLCANVFKGEDAAACRRAWCAGKEEGEEEVDGGLGCCEDHMWSCKVQVFKRSIQRSTQGCSSFVHVG